jgi:hypothetical protein
LEAARRGLTTTVRLRRPARICTRATGAAAMVVRVVIWRAIAIVFV